MGLSAQYESNLDSAFKKACQLSDTQSSFIDSAVYLGYFLAAIPAGLFIHRWGYKKGIIFGLSLFAVGSLLLFLPLM